MREREGSKRKGKGSKEGKGGKLCALCCVVNQCDCANRICIPGSPRYQERDPSRGTDVDIMSVKMHFPFFLDVTVCS